MQDIGLHEKYGLRNSPEGGGGGGGGKPYPASGLIITSHQSSVSHENKIAVGLF